MPAISPARESSESPQRPHVLFCRGLLLSMTTLTVDRLFHVTVTASERMFTVMVGYRWPDVAADVMMLPCMSRYLKELEEEMVGGCWLIAQVNKQNTACLCVCVCVCVCV